MKSTTFLDETACSIADFVSADSDLYCDGVRRRSWGFEIVEAMGLDDSDDWRKACYKVSNALLNPKYVVN